jgi:hypothetical protein
MRKIIVLLLLATLSGCASSWRERNDAFVREHEIRNEKAKDALVRHIPHLDKSHLEFNRSTGTKFVDQTCVQFIMEYRLPEDDNGLFTFYKMELNTTVDPPELLYLAVGTGQTERVLSQQEIELNNSQNIKRLSVSLYGH